MAEFFVFNGMGSLFKPEYLQYLLTLGRQCPEARFDFEERRMGLNDPAYAGKRGLRSPVATGHFQNMLIQIAERGVAAMRMHDGDDGFMLFHRYPRRGATYVVPLCFVRRLQLLRLRLQRQILLILPASPHEPSDQTRGRGTHERQCRLCTWH